MPIRSSLSTVFGPIPGTRPGESPANRSSASAAREDDQPGRLAELAGDLRQHAALGDPDRAGQPGLLADLGGDPAHRRLRREEPGEVDVGLVEADDLDRLGVAPQDRHHLAGGLAVGVEVGTQVDRVGQPPPGDRGRHRRVDPGQPPCLVAGRRHHRPRPRPADDDRLPPQLGAAPQLDRRVEGVHVEVGDDPGAVFDRHLSNGRSGPAARPYGRRWDARSWRTPSRLRSRFLLTGAGIPVAVRVTSTGPTAKPRMST